ncbi:hypothetical protein QFC22_000850 [Naganishia vaughanmartiniae]|uniref:Uncharacterized protein n=1 Tax=Naganishia vaughanmartiniae TaxID=1424756 RepID=A0ACC2XJC3_9TREE|nr:hypothetical protein QFC22_000850 [Naganishia vaughanmartiniae]
MYDLSKLQGLDEYQKSTLLKDASEVLLASPYELNKALKSSNTSEINRLLHDISAAICVQSQIASSLVTFEDDEDQEILQEDRLAPGWISTGDDAIDQVLGGGIRRGVLTEIAGESASGKSHFGLQLALTAQLPSHTDEPGGAILLTSERKISFTRLEQIVQSRIGEGKSTHDEPNSTGKQPFEARKYLDNVHTMHVTEVDGLEHALAYMVPNIIAVLAKSASSAADTPRNGNVVRLPVSLIVIDSIGALFRASYDSNQGGLPQRSKMLCVIADRLKYLAHKHNIAVVVINQVSDVFGRPSLIDNASRISRPGSPAPTTSRDQNSPAPEIAQPTMTYKVQSQYFSGQSNTLSKEASLGLVWANAVNVRIMLSRTGRRRPLDANDLTRRMKRPRTVDGKYRQELEEDTRANVIAERARNMDAAAAPLPTTSESSWEATLIRRMHLVFSPFAKQECIDYVILQSGIHSLPPADYHHSANGDTSLTAPNQSGPAAAQTQDAKEFGDDVFDDLGNLPVDFWNSEEFVQMQAEVAKEWNRNER